MEELNVIEEKFTRCPQCQSFSLKVSDELSPKERLKSKWVPVTVFKCNNCSYRYVEFGKFSDTLKRIFFSLIGRVERKWLLAAVPLAVIVILAGLLVLLPGNGDNEGNGKPVTVDDPPPAARVEDQKEDKTGDKKEEDKKEDRKPVTDDQQKPEDRKPEDRKPEDQPPVTEDQQKPEDRKPEVQPPVTDVQPEPEFTYIVLGNSNRFGVNWNSVAQGVQIRRLSDGPLKRAGIRLGDILSEVDGARVTNGNALLRIRNRIFRGGREEALIKVIRGGEVLYFKLVKTVKERAQNAAVDAASRVVKVFARTTIKIRSSAPDRVSASLKWSYSQKQIKVRRADNQRVWIAGDPSGNGKWAVDDKLIINGREFDGLTALYRQESGPLPDQAKRRPLDITDLVPPGKETVLNIELADHGQRWGNTDIYIIIKPDGVMTSGVNESNTAMAMNR